MLSNSIETAERTCRQQLCKLGVSVVASLSSGTEKTARLGIQPSCRTGHGYSPLCSSSNGRAAPAVPAFETNWKDLPNLKLSGAARSNYLSSRPNLRSRNGYEFSNKAGNWIAGHSGFPSVDDDPRTHPERVYDDSDGMIEKLAAIEQQLTNDGLSPNVIRRYVDALRAANTASTRATVERAIAQESYNAAERHAAVDILSGTRGARKKRQDQSKRTIAKMAANYLKRTSR